MRVQTIPQNARRHTLTLSSFAWNPTFGFAGGNNHALAHCDTEFVALLNPDAFPEPGWLGSLLQAAAARADVAAFGSRQLQDSQCSILDGIGDTYVISGLVSRKRDGMLQEPRDLFSQEVFSPCAAAALYRRQAILRIGGFDADFFCYMEDVDLGFRLRLAGQKAMYVPDAVVRHIGSATTGGRRSDFSVYHGHRNLIWTYFKNMPGILLWLLLPLHVAANVIAIARYAAVGRWRIIVKAKLHAILGLREGWNKRRRIQAARNASVGEIWRVLDKRFWTTRHD